MTTASNPQTPASVAQDPKSFDTESAVDSPAVAAAPSATAPLAASPVPSNVAGATSPVSPPSPASQTSPASPLNAGPLNISPLNRAQPLERPDSLSAVVDKSINRVQRHQDRLDQMMDQLVAAAPDPMEAIYEYVPALHLQIKAGAHLNQLIQTRLRIEARRAADAKVELERSSKSEESANCSPLQKGGVADKLRTAMGTAGRNDVMDLDLFAQFTSRMKSTPK